MKTTTPTHTEDLSFSQQNIWNLEQALPHTPINHICTTLFIDEYFDAEALQRTLNAVLEHDETLRTQLTLTEGRPRQYFVPFVPQSFPVLDFSAVTQAEFEAALRAAVDSGEAWVIDCAIDKDAMVHPMVPGGAPATEFLLD